MDWGAILYGGLKSVPVFGPIIQGGEVVNSAVEDAVPAVGNMIGRVAIIVLGLIFVAVGLMMFKPSVIVEASSEAGKAYRETKAANAASE